MFELLNIHTIQIKNLKISEIDCEVVIISVDDIRLELNNTSKVFLFKFEFEKNKLTIHIAVPEDEDLVEYLKTFISMTSKHLVKDCCLTSVVNTGLVFTKTGDSEDSGRYWIARLILDKKCQQVFPDMDLWKEKTSKLIELLEFPKNLSLFWSNGEFSGLKIAELVAEQRYEVQPPPPNYCLRINKVIIDLFGKYAQLTFHNWQEASEHDMWGYTSYYSYETKYSRKILETGWDFTTLNPFINEDDHDTILARSITTELMEKKLKKSSE